MACTTGIAKNIVSNCTTQPVGGLEVVAYIGNRLDFTPTYDGTSPCKVTALTAVGPAVIYKLTGVKKNLNAGHDRNIADDMADSFKHYFSFKGFEGLSADVLNLDGLNDVIVVVEYKQKQTGGDGTFVVYGLKSGLYVTADSKRANDLNGTRNIELATRDQEGEPYSQYNLLVTDYATTKSTLEGLLT